MTTTARIENLKTDTPTIIIFGNVDKIGNERTIRDILSNSVYVGKEFSLFYYPCHHGNPANKFEWVADYFKHINYAETTPYNLFITNDIFLFNSLETYLKVSKMWENTSVWTITDAPTLTGYELKDVTETLDKDIYGPTFRVLQDLENLEWGIN